MEYNLPVWIFPRGLCLERLRARSGTGSRTRSLPSGRKRTGSTSPKQQSTCTLYMFT